MAHTLVLNASFEPLAVVSDRRALVLVLSHKAVLLEESGHVVHSATRCLALPSVIRLARYVRVPHRAHVPLTRRALFARDRGRCVYCGNTATSVDHVVPRSRGGRHAWDNVVAACGRCNRTKADRTLAELGWRLRAAPRQADRVGVAGARHRAVRPALGAVPLRSRLPRRGVGLRLTPLSGRNAALHR